MGSDLFMNKKIKNLLSTLLLTIFISSIGNYATGVQASAIDNISTISTIAKNTPKYLLGNTSEDWNAVSIINNRPLYDFNNKLIAYSVDLKNKINDEKAYVIVSVNEEDEPIIEFAIGHFSPYDKVDENSQTCIYDGVLSYYSKQIQASTTKYYDINKNYELGDLAAQDLISSSKNKRYTSLNPIKSKETRNKLMSTNNINNADVSNTKAIINNLATASTSKILSVPRYQWYKGCAPTSAAMVIKYNYSSSYVSTVSSTTLIAKLATNMYTNSAGSTYTTNLPSGVIATMVAYGVSSHCYNDTSGSGKAGNTFAEYCSEINSNKSLEVSLFGNTTPTTAYPSGFGDHSVAGIGYSTYNGSYEIVNDTSVSDGAIYCNYNSSSFGTPWYTYFH